MSHFMQYPILYIFAAFVLYFLLSSLYEYYKYKRLSYIEDYHFNPAIGKKVQEKYTHLTDQDVQLVLEGLRSYFYICNKANRKMVSMPSQVVDVAWHEFILFTRSYQLFCKKGIGRFLHHTPTEAMSSPTVAQKGIKRAWRLACAKERINPSKPTKLPLLFLLDSKLNIKDGFKYSLNCKDKSSPLYGDSFCASHIGCSSSCSGSSRSAADNPSGCGSSCGGD
ncbi:MAG: hypothetical protein K6L75_12065 [Cellvibrionaceae bacterium]